MPKPRQPLPLQLWCLDKMVEVLLVIRKNDAKCKETNALEEYFKFKIPLKLLRLLENNLWKKHRIHTCHVIFLLRCGLDVLESPLAWDNMAKAGECVAFDMDLITQMCMKSLQNLKVFDISWVSCRIDKANFKDFILNISNLRILNLAFSCCTDEFLEIITGTCKELRKLNLSGCGVTDRGIVHLGRLKNLKVLRLMPTEVSAQGGALILQTLTSLEEFQFNYMMETMCLAYLLDRQKNPEQAEVRSYNLTSVRFLGVRILTDEDINDILAYEILARSCRRLTKMYSNVATENAVFGIQYLIHCPHLTSLSLNFNFSLVNAGMAVLQTIGKQLTELSILCAHNLDIYTLSLYCPNLTYLLLQYVRYRRRLAELPGSRFPNLLTLDVRGDVPHEILHELFLGSPLTEELSVGYCWNLSDALVLRLGQQLVPKLTRLNLAGCGNITWSGLQNLLFGNNWVKEICLNCCFQLNVIPHDLSTNIKSNNLDLSLLVTDADFQMQQLGY